MKYVLCKYINKHEIYYMVTNMAKEVISYDENTFLKYKDKFCDFYSDRLAVINNNQCLNYSYILLGKFMRSKNKSYYLISDPYGKRISLSREDLIQKVNLGLVFSNATIKNNIIRFKNGSIPILNNQTRNNIHRDTVVKLGTIDSGTPGSIGVNKKFFGKRLNDNKLGVVKFSLPGSDYDIINEVVCSELGKLFGFDVAEASLEYYNNTSCVISCYKDNSIAYNEKPKSLKSYITPENFRKTFSMDWIVSQFSFECKKKFIQMVMFDFLTRQEDRHISNIAFYKESLYSLYDNGRSLYFSSYNEKRRIIDFHRRDSIVNDFITNEHGYGWMFLEDVIGFSVYKDYINLNVTYTDIQAILTKYYADKNRADWTSKYIFKVYQMLLRKE